MTMMIDGIGGWALFALGGAAIGAAYFGGLWWTVRRLPQAGRPHLLAMGSLLVRGGLALVGFGLIARSGRWEPLVASLLGLLAVRWILVRRWGPGGRAGGGATVGARTRRLET